MNFWKKSKWPLIPPHFQIIIFQNLQQRLHPPFFYTEILSKIWVSSCLSEWKSEFCRANLQYTLIHAPEWIVGTSMEVYKIWFMFNCSLVCEIHIVKWGWICVILWFFNLLSVKMLIFSRVSHITHFFELSLVLLTTHAIRLYEVKKKIQRYRQ